VDPSPAFRATRAWQRGGKLVSEAAAAPAAGEVDGMPQSHQSAGEPETVGYRGVAAMRAAGISYRQLDYWARTGLVTPSIRDASGSGTQRLYSFRDLVVLKVVKSLLDAGVSLQNIRKAIDTLRAHGVEDLAGLTLISDGTTVYECRSPEEVVDLLQGGQGVFGIAIGGACREIEGTLTHLPADRGAEPAAEETGETPAATPVTGQAVAGPADELAARRARRRAS
jgi:DNA-binding transcriptional MerR regulator